jgi:hypothetical protein
MDARMKRVAAFLSLLLLPVLALAQTAQTYFTVDTVAGLTALTSRPSIIKVIGGGTTSNAVTGLYRWYAGDSTTANGVSIVQPASGPAGRYKLIEKIAADTNDILTIGSGTGSVFSSATKQSIMIGNLAGADSTSADNLLAIGYGACQNTVSGRTTICLGTFSGMSSNGASNTFLSPFAGEGSKQAAGQTAAFTASIGSTFTGTGTGTTLAVTGITGYLSPGDVITGTGVPASTTIVSQSTGTPGSNGNYITNNATTSSGATITAASVVLRVTAVANGVLRPGMLVRGTGISDQDINIDGPLAGTGTGGTGTYNLVTAGGLLLIPMTPLTIASEAMTSPGFGAIYGANITLAGEASGLHLAGVAKGISGFGYNAFFWARTAQYLAGVGQGVGGMIVDQPGAALVGTSAFAKGDGPYAAVIGYNAGYGTTSGFITATGIAAVGATTVPVSSVSGLAPGQIFYMGCCTMSGTKIVSVGASSVVIDQPLRVATSVDSLIEIIPNQYTGTGLTALGAFSCGALQGAEHYATCVGYQALSSWTTGQRNTAVGGQSFTVLTTTSDSTGLGYQAGRLQTGSRNSFGGSGAGSGVTNPSTGDDNSTWGYNTLSVGNGAFRNSLFGSGAGAGISTGDDNFCGGYQACSTTTSGSKNIAIGTGANSTSASASNTLNIGDAIFGTGISGGTVKIGIATAAPSVTFEVNGTFNAVTAIQANGTPGLSVTKTVRASGGAADCNLVFTMGLLTSSTC